MQVGGASRPSGVDVTGPPATCGAHPHLNVCRHLSLPAEHYGYRRSLAFLILCLFFIFGTSIDCEFVRKLVHIGRDLDLYPTIPLK